MSSHLYVGKTFVRTTNACFEFWCLVRVTCFWSNLVKRGNTCGSGLSKHFIVISTLMHLTLKFLLWRGTIWKQKKSNILTIHLTKSIMHASLHLMQTAPSNKYLFPPRVSSSKRPQLPCLVSNHIKRLSRPTSNIWYFIHEIVKENQYFPLTFRILKQCINWRLCCHFVYSH